MAKRDFYEVLGVPRTATPEEIKQAYRRLARQYHPDVAKENPKVAEEKFKELSEAYEVLANPETRTRYDQGGASAVESDFGPGGFGWQNFTHASDLEDLLGANPLFQQFFGNLSGFGGRRSSGRGQDIEVTIQLPLAAALTGAQPTVEVPREEPCSACRGTGAKDGTALEVCSECGGSGQVRRVQNRGYTQLITVAECPRCHGAGRRILERCRVCGGSGRIRSSEKIELTVPAGIEDGAVLRVPNHGLKPAGRGIPGDLFVQVVFEPLPHIRREGTEAYTETAVPLGIALLGGEVTVRTIDGHAVLKIPAGTQPETQFRLRGEGFPRFRGSTRGDLLVTAHVEVPRSLSGHDRDVLRDVLLPGGRPVGARRESIFHRRSP
jgi:molecular chaperone DnaJ